MGLHPILLDAFGPSWPLSATACPSCMLFFLLVVFLDVLVKGWVCVYSSFSLGRVEFVCGGIILIPWPLARVDFCWGRSRTFPATHADCFGKPVGILDLSIPDFDIPMGGIL